jgi:hypothetical protein
MRNSYFRLRSAASPKNTGNVTCVWTHWFASKLLKAKSVGPSTVPAHHSRGILLVTRTAVAMLFVTAVAVLPCSAQFNSSIRGIVADPAGAGVPGATAKLTNLGTNISSITTTDSSGAYDFRSLSAGEYRLDVEATNFSPASIHSTLETDQTLNVQVKLLLSSVSQSVEVQSEAPALDTADSRLQTTLPQNQIDTLPMQGRTVISLISLAPGVSGLGLLAAGGTPPDNFNVETYNTVSANGRGFDGNLYVIDGLDITSSVRAGVINTSPNPDTIQEVAIQTNTYSSEYGRAGSIQTVMTTKSGTNRFHGSGSYFYTSKALWTSAAFSPISHKAPFHYNNFSGTIGGPIYKNHTFFFASVEPLRSLSTGGGATSFEAPEFVAWSQANNPNSLGTRLMTKYPMSSSTTTTGVAKRASDVLGTACGTPATQNIPCSLPMIDSGNSSLNPYRNGTQWSIRGDQNLKSDRLYSSYYNTTLATLTASARSGMNISNSQVSHSFQLNETHTFSPKMLNEAAYGYLAIEGIAGVAGPFDIPIITITGQGTGIGVGPAHQDFIQHNYHWRDTFNLVRGHHNIRLGVEGFHGDELTLFGPQHNQPTFLFDNLYTLSTDKPRNESNVYYNPFTGQLAFFSLGVASTTGGGFVQDEWQITPHLTITAGIRFDLFGNPHGSQALKSVISNFYIGSGNDKLTQVSNGSLKQTQYVLASSPKAWSPRLGVAWDPTGSGKWAIRGGVGIYHDWFTNGELTVALRANLPVYANPTFLATQGTAPIFAVGTSATYPFGYPLPVVQPTTPDGHGGVPGQQYSIGGTDPNLKEPRVLNYTIGLERQIGKHIVVSANYAGSQAVNLPEGDVASINLDNDVNRVTGNLVVHNNILTRPNSSFGTIFYTVNGNQSSYNAFIATVKGRFGSKDNFQASYTRSESSDYGQQYPDTSLAPSTYKGPTSFNTPQRFSLSESLQLPLFTNRNLITREVAGGWVVSGAVILQSGNPFTVYTTAAFQPTFNSSNQVNGFKAGSGDYNADGYNYDFPNAPTNGYQHTTSRQAYINTGVISASQFPIPALGTNGNEQRNLFSGPGYANADLSLLKNIVIREPYRLEGRVEFFDLLNHPNLTSFVSDLSSSNFGRATQAFNPRYIQLGARFIF